MATPSAQPAARARNGVNQGARARPELSIRWGTSTTAAETAREPRMSLCERETRTRGVSACAGGPLMQRQGLEVPEAAASRRDAPHARRPGLEPADLGDRQAEPPGERRRGGPAPAQAEEQLVVLAAGERQALGIEPRAPAGAREPRRPRKPPGVDPRGDAGGPAQVAEVGGEPVGDVDARPHVAEPREPYTRDEARRRNVTHAADRPLERAPTEHARHEEPIARPAAVAAQGAARRHGAERGERGGQLARARHVAAHERSALPARLDQHPADEVEQPRDG